jgi:iron complex transport system substrate-binding protein
MSARISCAHFARLVIPFALLVALVVGCAQPRQPAGDAASAPAQPSAPPVASGNPDGCVEQYDKRTDYFPKRATFDDATGVTATYTNTTKLLEITRPWKGADETFRALLVQCGTPVPDGVAADVVVEVPVRKVATFSTTQLPSFAMLGQVDTIVAHGGLQYVSTPEVLQAAKAKDVVEVGDQTNPDVEALIAAAPDVALVSAGVDGDMHRKAIAAVGVPALPYGDWLEESLLGRAEWLKVVGMLTNTEAAATAKFARIAQAFEDIRSRADGMTTHPKVLVGSPYEGTWFMPAGDSYVSAALEDLGADYPWADTSGTGALSLDIETVIDKAADADVWLGVGSVQGTYRDLKVIDERFSVFRPVRTKAVYAEDRQVNDAGGNALFELGAVRPDLLIADVFKMLYPRQAGDIDFTFYGRVGELRKGG